MDDESTPPLSGFSSCVNTVLAFFRGRRKPIGNERSHEMCDDATVSVSEGERNAFICDPLDLTIGYPGVVIDYYVDDTPLSAFSDAYDSFEGTELDEQQFFLPALMVSPKDEPEPEPKRAPYVRSYPFAYPCNLFVLSAVMWSMYSVALVLKMGGFNWHEYSRGTYFSLFQSWNWRALLEWILPPSEPPDSGTDPLGYSLHDVMREQAWFDADDQVFYYEESDGEPLTPLPTTRSSRRARGKAKLLLLTLMAAMAKAESLPAISLVGDRKLRKQLRTCRNNQGVLDSTKLKPEEAVKVQQVLQAMPQGLLSDEDMKLIILDTGCSEIVSGFESDFLKGTLQKLSTPKAMDGVGGSLHATHKGLLRYEVITDNGELEVIEAKGYYMPELHCRLFSPQVYFQQLIEKGLGKGCLGIEYDKSTLEFPSGKKLTVGYESTVKLPVMHAFDSALETAEALAMGCVTAESNQNITRLQKVLLQWHFRLGHIAFGTVQWIGRQGWLGKLGEKMGSTSVKAPKCAACLYGKQERTPKQGSTTTPDSRGALKRDELTPGDLVFSDQYESRQPGRVFTRRGMSKSSETYCGGTLYCDAASGFIYVYHQVALTGAETVRSKVAFERDASTAGVSVHKYRTDNGVYTSQAFHDALEPEGDSTKSQGLSHSGVGGHHHNGVAEWGIKHVVRLARTMMIHAALRWPEVVNKDLWPLALSHAAYVHNHTPNTEHGFAPLELWTVTKSSHTALQTAHPWGCPVYVLEPKLQDGQKIPKWQPRSHRGQYVGASPVHASTVGLIRHLTTENISPQFHCVYDDFFETIDSTDEQEPAVWPELVVVQSFRSEFNDEDYVPQLPDEWLTPAELEAKYPRAPSQREMSRGIGAEAPRPPTETPNNTVEH